METRPSDGRKVRTKLNAMCALASSVALAASVALACGAAGADTGPPVDPRKKLIFFACSSLRPDTVGAHLADLRSEYPGLDGLVIHFWPDDWKYVHMGGRHGLFCPRRYAEENFRKTIDDLSTVDFGHIRENFFRITTTVGATPKMPATPEETLNIDWFDDRWSVIADNMALYAGIAREVGFKGLMLDFEEYPQTHNALWQVFRYKAFKNHRERNALPAKTFDDYARRVRECGRLMMEKVTNAYPEMTLLMIPDTGWPGHDHYDLLPGFVDGILEGAGPKVKLIDGLEQGYPLQTYDDFMKLKQRARRDGLKASRVPDLHRSRLRYSIGVWPDYRPDDFGGWHTEPGTLERNFRSPKRLEQALYNAFTVSDEYVWLYFWEIDFWLRPATRRKPYAGLMHPHQCILCPHRDMPRAYLDALVKCREPHDLAWQSPVSLAQKLYTPEDLARMGPNILENASFESWTGGPDTAPDNWIAAVEVSRKEESHMWIQQPIPPEKFRGKTIVLGVWCKLTPNSDCSVTIQSKVGPRYLGPGRRGPVLPARDGKWHFIAAREVVPDKAEKINLRLNAYSQEPWAPIQFDGVIAVVEE